MHRRNEEDTDPLGPSTSLLVVEQSSIRSGTDTTARTVRRSLYNSLPLYWPKNWRTHSSSVSQEEVNADLATNRNNPSAAAADLPPSQQHADASPPLLHGPRGNATSNCGKRRKSMDRRKGQHRQQRSMQSPLLLRGTKGGTDQADPTSWPTCQNQRPRTRTHRLLLLLLISSLLFLPLILLIFLRPHLFHQSTQNDIGTVDDLINQQEQLLDGADLRTLRGAYSDIRPFTSEDAQIWLLNTHEFRRRHRRTGRTDPLLFGLAQICGQLCNVRLRHGIRNGSEGQPGQIQVQSLQIRLERRITDGSPTFDEGSSPNSTSSGQYASPTIVQTLDSPDQSQFRHSHISPACFYTARVGDRSESSDSVVNLCDRNGGLFGTLVLTDGTFVIEPLVIGVGEDDQRIGTRKRKRHLASPDLRAHLIYRLQTHHFEDYLKRNSSGESAEQSGEFERNPGPNPEPNLNNNGTLVTVLKDPIHRRSGRSTNSWEHFVEVLVVTDYKMLLYHQQNLENYVLTLFATVSSIYRHPSLGASINVIVVRLVVLKNERAGPAVSNRAQETLQQFCHWQQLLNDRNDDALNHHDVAILLTRHDICRATNKCDTLGLAELGTICDGRKSCAIIEDNGLSAAFTIAHELGHIFNIPHDDERKCAEFMPLNKYNYHIMAPTLEFNTNPWSWSPCSSAMLLRFLDHRRSQTECLLDQPAERRYYDKMFDVPAPGAVYSVSQQCKFVFGAAAEICPYMPTCRRLWCSVSYGYQMGCRTQHMPWADGTPCADNMWCHRGQCVGMSPMQRQPVDGGWGEWKPWKECSRTCGGGVQKANRECDSPQPENGGKYCVGQRERYRPCNIQDCPLDTPGFRELQCAEFDGKDIGIHGVPKELKWVPKYTGVADNERCRLYCRGADSAAFYLLKEKVIDGTPCDRHGDDICIDGNCHKAGCDHRLGSDMKRDICGVCGGDSTSCREVKGVYNERGTFGYNEVLRIPAGSAGVDITQTAHNSLKADENYLALRMANGEFLLNGQYQVSVFRQQIPILDTVLEYSGSDKAVERINGTGPLRMDIYLHVLSVGALSAPNIRYQFMHPITHPSQIPAQNTNFFWRHGTNNWTECSAKCQGVQSQQLQCIKSATNRPVPETYCGNIRQPDAQRRMCNVECFYKFQQRLNADSAGRKWYQNICVRSYTNGKEEQATEAECQAAGVKVPGNGGTDTQQPQQQTQKDQNQQQKQQNPAIPTDRRWAYSQWSQCSESCGTQGLSRRSLHCIDTRNGQKLDGRYCEGIPHESIETECNRIPCPSWQYGGWTECSRSCGGGIRVRHSTCQDAAGREVNARMCSGEPKLESEKCNQHMCTRWSFGTWSPCSVSCGEGIERRDAVCVSETDGRRLEDGACEPRERIVEKPCQRAACPQWQLGSWSQCTVSCGQDGFQTRLVQCVDSAGRKLADQQCLTKDITEKPQSHKVCSPGPCPYWRVGEWSPCSVSCGQGVKHRTVECVQAAQIVDDSLCQEAQKPPRQDRCVLLACAVWEPEAWGPCSTTCGWGVQRRNVNCVRMSSSSNHQRPLNSGNTLKSSPTSSSIVLHDRECTGQKPRTERTCDRTSECPLNNNNDNGGNGKNADVQWSAGPWSECNQKCGQVASGGVQRRVVECRAKGREMPTAYCAHLERPVQSQPCTPAKISACPQWNINDWELCPVSCADPTNPAPYQQRRVVCQFSNGTEAKDPTECAGPRPEERRPCAGLAPCPPAAQKGNGRKEKGRWETGDWSPCSLTCGGGWKRRSVFCNNGSGSVGPCADTERPAQFEQCNTQDCGIGTWQIGDWSQCSVSCGQGEQTRPVWCNSVVNPLQKLEEHLCPAEGKPVKRRSCAKPECPSQSPKTTNLSTSQPSLDPSSVARNGSAGRVMALVGPASSLNSSTTSSPPLPNYRWESGPWSSCPRQCKPNTARTRWVHCTDSANGSEVDAAKCDRDEKPPTEHPCRPTNCPRWQKGRWGMCSTSCGSGVARRTVFCRRGRGAVRLAPDSECLALGPKPFETRKCEMAQCPSYRWRVTSWSKCIDPCKPTEQRRKVFCMSEQGKRAAPNMCDQSGTAQPTERRKCPTDKCPYHWVPGPWSTCSRSCGTGFHFRSIECKVRMDMATRRTENGSSSTNNNNSSPKSGSEPTVLSRMCMALEKPIVSKQCEMNPCDAEYRWSVGPWSQCSKECGRGFRRRKVRCLDRLEGRADKSKCDERNRPKRREACFVRNCLPGDCAELKDQNGQMMDSNYTVLVTGFRIEVYCHRMNETIPKTFLNVPSGTNFAEFYGKRLKDSFTCPYNGHRNDSCACTDGGHAQAGFTRFSKVRVDLQNLKINPNDQSFAVIEYGKPVAYGTAGDCYSSSSRCPQGRFSIDLRGTGLRLVDDLQWREQGHRTSMNIERSENNALVEGSCGGYCGECAPDRFKGLVIEIDPKQKPLLGIG